MPQLHIVSSYQVRDWWMLSAQELYLLQNLVEDRHHPALVLTVSLYRPTETAFLKTTNGTIKIQFKAQDVFGF